MGLYVLAHNLMHMVRIARQLTSSGIGACALIDKAAQGEQKDPQTANAPSS